MYLCKEPGVSDWIEMGLFVHIAELGSLTKAAVRLNLTQSAVSRRIAAFEARLGGRLFYRTGRGVRLTELGQSILPRVQALLGEAERLVQDAALLSDRPSGVVTLGVLPSLSRPLVRELFRAVRAQMPEVRLAINEAFGGLLDEAVANGSVDLAILNRYGPQPPAGEELLARTDMLLIGPKGDALTARREVDFKELAGLDLLLPSAPNAWRSLLDKTARRHGFALREAMVIDAVALLADVVAAEGGCFAIVPGYAVRDDLRAGRLQAARIVRPGLSRMVTLSLTAQRPMSLATREVGRLLRAMVPALVN